MDRWKMTHYPQSLCVKITDDCNNCYSVASVDPGLANQDFTQRHKFSSNTEIAGEKATNFALLSFQMPFSINF